MHETLDVRGLKCPLPALFAKRMMKTLPSNTRLTVLADDPMAVVDIPHMCHREGHSVESIVTHEAFHEIALKVGDANHRD